MEHDDDGSVPPGARDGRGRAAARALPGGWARSTCAASASRATSWRGMPGSRISPSPCRASAPGRSRCSARGAARARAARRARRHGARRLRAERAGGGQRRRGAGHGREKDGNGHYRLTGARPGSAMAASPRPMSSSRAPARRRARRASPPSWCRCRCAGLLVAERIEVTAPHPLATLRFDGVRVPAEAMIGRPGEGFAVAMATLDVFRATVGAAALGFARRALDMTLERANRRLFGAPLFDQQMSAGRHRRQRDGGRGLRAARLSRRLAEGSGAPRVTREAAMAKLHATESRAARRRPLRADAWRARRHEGPQGRGTLPRGPGAARLRGRLGGAARGDRARRATLAGSDDRRRRWTG
jgi:hypothetical protein